MRSVSYQGMDILVPDQVVFKIRVRTKKDPIKKGRGLLKDLPGLAEDLLMEGVKEQKHENTNG